MHSCIENCVRTQIFKLHVALSLIVHLLHLQLHAALHVQHNIYTYMIHCNSVITSTKATQNQFKHNKKILMLK